MSKVLLATGRVGRPSEREGGSERRFDAPGSYRRGGNGNWFGGADSVGKGAAEADAGLPVSVPPDRALPCASSDCPGNSQGKNVNCKNMNSIADEINFNRRQRLRRGLRIPTKSTLAPRLGINL